MSKKVVIISIVAIAMVAIGIVLAMFGYRSIVKSGAESEASKFALTLAIKDANISCVAADSDGDGYYPCTVFDVAKDKMYPVECTSILTINSGCKLNRTSVITQ